MTTHLEIDVEIAPDRGFVRIGATRVPVVPDGSGTLRVAGSARLRTLTVRERDAIVREALVADDAPLALEIAVLQRAVIDAGDLPLSTLTALALAVAGGGTARLALDETTRLACEREGWSWAETLSAPAWLADRAALYDTAPDDGWSRIVFGASIPPDTDALARSMSENLLRRAAAAEFVAADPAVVGTEEAGTEESGFPSEADDATRSVRSSRSGRPARAIHVGKEALTARRERRRERYTLESKSPAGLPEARATRPRHSPHLLEDPGWESADVRTGPEGQLDSGHTGVPQESVFAASVFSRAFTGADVLRLQQTKRCLLANPASEPNCETTAGWVGHLERGTVDCFGHKTPRPSRRTVKALNRDNEAWRRGSRPPGQPVVPAWLSTQYAYPDEAPSRAVAGPQIDRPAETAGARCARPSRRLERSADGPDRAPLAVADWTRDLARALATECDLRGLDP